MTIFEIISFRLLNFNSVSFINAKQSIIIEKISENLLSDFTKKSNIWKNGKSMILDLVKSVENEIDNRFNQGKTSQCGDSGLFVWIQKVMNFVVLCLI